MDTDIADRQPSRRQLTHLVESGQLTEAQAAQLQAGDPAVAGLMAGIRARHATERLGRAVAAGRVSEDEASQLVEQVRAGDHSPELRREINRLVRLAGVPDEDAS
jgi:hypothetical protein